MKLTYKQTKKRPGKSFFARHETIPCIEQDWHFHPELELIYFLKSTGVRYVGNSIGNFEEGEIYLIGGNVPHLFRNHREYYNDQGMKEGVDLVIVKFKKDFLGETLYNLPESIRLQNLFNNANRGLKFPKSTSYLTHTQMMGLVEANGLSRILDLLEILDILSVNENFSFLCSNGFNNAYDVNEKERMARVISYLHENFDKKIELETVASIAHMTPNSFCRYFKKRTEKSLMQFLNEIRIGHACKLLIEGKYQITAICYQSGFNTLTNFNRQFKAIMNMTPTEYMDLYQLYEDMSLEVV